MRRQSPRQQHELPVAAGPVLRSSDDNQNASVARHLGFGEQSQCVLTGDLEDDRAFRVVHETSRRPNTGNVANASSVAATRA